MALVGGGGDVLDLGGDQIQDLVEDMRAPVGERATGDALIGVPQVARVSEPADERLDVEDVTEGTCSHSASHREVVGVEPSVLVDDNQPVECIGLSKDDICLVGVDRERLLNHNVLAGADGAKCPVRVGAGRGGHHDEVDVVTFEQLVGVAQDDDSVSNGRRRGQPGGRGVADGRERQSIDSTHRSAVLVPDSAVPEQTDADDRRFRLDGDVAQQLQQRTRHHTVIDCGRTRADSKHRRRRG
jgi:hypothetical protein